MRNVDTRPEGGRRHANRRGSSGRSSTPSGRARRLLPYGRGSSGSSPSSPKFLKFKNWSEIRQKKISDSDNDAQQMKKIDSNHFKTFNESSLIQRRRLRRHRYFFGYCCPSEKYGWWNFQAWAEPSFWFRKIDSDEILIDNVFREMVLRNKENFDEYCFRQQVLFFFAQIWNILTIFPSKTLQNFAEIRT